MNILKKNASGILYIDNEEVIKLHKLAFQLAENSNSNIVKVIGADDIANHLESFLYKKFSNLDLTKADFYKSYHNLFLNWNAPSDPYFEEDENATEEENKKREEDYVQNCNGWRYAAVQQIAISTLKNCREKQIKNNLCVHQKFMAENYRDYLAKAIRNNVNKITNKNKLIEIHHAITSDAVDNPAKIPADIDIKGLHNKIYTALMSRIPGDNDITLKSLLSSNLHQAMKKHAIIKSAIGILDGHEESKEKIEVYYDYLKQNKKDLLKLRDTGLTTFLKGLGVAAATIFGLGIGGYVAYHQLFKARGSKFIDTVNHLEYHYKKSV